MPSCTLIKINYAFLKSNVTQDGFVQKTVCFLEAFVKRLSKTLLVVDQGISNSVDPKVYNFDYNFTLMYVEYDDIYTLVM
jgi:hypothetical protein